MGTYLGQGPFKEFSSSPTKDLFTGDGSTTTFDLGNEVVGGGEFALEVYIDNVRQEPGTGKAFTLGVDGSNATKRLTFTSAPANGAYIYVINDKTNLTSVAPLQNDLNGTELVLDGDGDTSITADTDDRIDFRISDADHFYLGTSSGDTTFKIAVDAKDFIFQQYDGRNILEINDAGYVALANGATGPGQLRLYEDTDLGTNYSAFQVGTQSGDITYTLPTADGSDGHALKTDGSGTLTWGAVAANTPTSADGQALGSASLEWSDIFLADGSIIYFGNDQEIKLTHVADTGLTLKHTATADDKPVSLTLQTGETDIAADDVIGKIDFQAPDEGTGTDAILVAAGIEAVSEGDFSSSNNATKLSFKTASSEAAAEKMSLSSAGMLAIGGAIYENSTTISANYTIGTNNNAMSAGPITINSGISVTVPSGSAWAII